jgi:hypothetical protein
MTQVKTTMMAVCGLDCATCDIRLIPLDDQAAQRAIGWYKQMGWLKEDEGVKEAIERKMYCQGCRSDRTIHWSADCPILLCCVDDKHLEHCGQCDDLFTCQHIEAFVGQDPGRHGEAIELLKQIAQEAGRS